MGCSTGELIVTQYHKKMVDKKLITYGSDDEYLNTQKLKPAIIAKYKAACLPTQPGKLEKAPKVTNLQPLVTNDGVNQALHDMVQALSAEMRTVRGGLRVVEAEMCEAKEAISATTKVLKHIMQPIIPTPGLDQPPSAPDMDGSLYQFPMNPPLHGSAVFESRWISGPSTSQRHWNDSTFDLSTQANLETAFAQGSSQGQTAREMCEAWEDDWDDSEESQGKME
ncbi:hypothetical protein PILCRDRAFT_90046 [Piloderma croceum F 1598]|uniref:Uncharacterized protein n=1 Tax=Piloderma croceum (strain F 1598) TaxID=765440 RepID=A0A0C3FJQ6_PILCF|nr:hypothetical protein PILCRDRAFT_90046 [Piloderma croceum F 1598]